MKIKVRVTRQDIRDGDDQCSNCPVTLATERALKKAGLPFTVEFVPYACFVEPRGLEILAGPWGSDSLCAIPVHMLPNGPCEFAEEFDQWYREREEPEDWDNYNDEPWCRPMRPGPFSFELQLPFVAKD
jgi:hypothetical protein